MSSIPNSHEHDHRGDIVSGYLLHDRLGSGAFASVYKGILSHHSKIDLHRHQSTPVVAVKAMARTANLDQFAGEIEIMKNLRHPNLVKMYRTEQSNSHIYLILEYCAGGDLKSALISHKRFSEPLCSRLMSDIISGLNYLVKNDLVHRDIKPHNLLLTGSLPFDETQVEHIGSDSCPLLKIADFGVARHLQETLLAETFCGTPLYMAPEVLTHQRYDNKCDLWSVGVVLFEMLFGKTPFHGRNQGELLLNIQRSSKMSFPSDIIVSNECSYLLRILLVQDPLQRATYKEFFAASNAFITNGRGERTSGLRQGKTVRNFLPIFSEEPLNGASAANLNVQTEEVYELEAPSSAQKDTTKEMIIMKGIEDENKEIPPGTSACEQPRYTTLRIKNESSLNASMEDGSFSVIDHLGDSVMLSSRSSICASQKLQAQQEGLNSPEQMKEMASTQPHPREKSTIRQTFVKGLLHIESTNSHAEDGRDESTKLGEELDKVINLSTLSSGSDERRSDGSNKQSFDINNKLAIETVSSFTRGKENLIGNNIRDGGGVVTKLVECLDKEMEVSIPSLNFGEEHNGGGNKGCPDTNDAVDTKAISLSNDERGEIFFAKSKADNSNHPVLRSIEFDDNDKDRRSVQKLFFGKCQSYGGCDGDVFVVDSLKDVPDPRCGGNMSLSGSSGCSNGRIMAAENEGNNIVPGVNQKGIISSTCNTFTDGKREGSSVICMPSEGGERTADDLESFVIREGFKQCKGKKNTNLTHDDCERVDKSIGLAITNAAKSMFWMKKYESPRGKHLFSVFGAIASMAVAISVYFSLLPMIDTLDLRPTHGCNVQEPAIIGKPPMTTEVESMTRTTKYNIYQTKPCEGELPGSFVNAETLWRTKKYLAFFHNDKFTPYTCPAYDQGSNDEQCATVELFRYNDFDATNFIDDGTPQSTIKGNRENPSKRSDLSKTHLNESLSEAERFNDIELITGGFFYAMELKVPKAADVNEASKLFAQEIPTSINATSPVGSGGKSHQQDFNEEELIENKTLASCCPCHSQVEHDEGKSIQDKDLSQGFRFLRTLEFSFFFAIFVLGICVIRDFYRTHLAQPHHKMLF